MSKRFTACFNCPDRTEYGLCHATCEKYLKSVEQAREENRIRKLTNKLDSYEFDRYDGKRKK